MSKAIWQQLGIARTNDLSAIRKAYAARLMAIDHETDASAFQALRSARDQAFWEARNSTAQRSYNNQAERDTCYSKTIVVEPEPAHETLEPAYLANDDFDYEHLVRDGVGRWDAGEAQATAAHDESQLAKLSHILFPDGEYSDDAMTFEEFEEADNLLDALFLEAQQGTLDRHQLIEQYLAEMLAQAWPRSFPVLERADEEFGWSREEGQLNEGSALMFLNARLRGVRFEQDVVASSHPYHRAWTYLASEGSPRITDWLTVSRDNTRELIGCIRNHFPELESRLNPSRVAGALGQGDGATPSVPYWVWFLIVFGGLRAIAGFASEASDATAPSGGPYVEVLPPEAVPVLESDTITAELYGQSDPAAQTAIAANAEMAHRVNETHLRSRGAIDGGEQILDMAILKLRLEMLLAGREADFSELVQLRALQRDWLRLANSQSNGCEEFRQSLALPEGVEMPESLRQRERQLAWTFSQKGLIKPGVLRPAVTSAAVPGWVIGDIIEQTGMSESEVHAGLKGSGKFNCTLEIALLDAVLRQPGEVSADLLRLDR